MLTENKSRNKLFWGLNLPTCRNAALKVLTFLEKQDIEVLCEATSGLENRHFLASLAQNMRFINKYINVADKSLYFTFCEEEQYKRIEVHQVAAISRKHPQIFSRYSKGFEEVTKCLREQVPVVQQELSALLEMIVNPDLPLPQLKRETQGMFCTSPFQLFLVHSTFQEEEEDIYTSFQNLQDFLTIDKEEEYLKKFMMILKDKANGGTEIKKIIKVRYTPYQITATNFTQFLLEDNQLHNFIVGLFALTDNLLSAIYDYLNMIEDPLHKLVELTLRYNIYRNYVLAVEEMLAFAFNIYDNIYRESIEESTSKPKYKFWRPAMTKWFLKMGSLHQQAQQVYMHCLTKLRNNKLKQTLTELCREDQLRYGRLLQLVEMNSFEFDLGKNVSNKGDNEVCSFFEGNPDNYEVIVMEFNDYLVDISVNEQTVHWCGHSQHQLEAPYLNYQTSLSQLSLDYYKSMLEEKEVSKADISQMAKIDTDYLSCLQIKNRTLKKIMEDLNAAYQLDEELTLNSNFQECDNKLEYFNHKALILAVVDEKARPFYSIPPIYSPEKLIDMIDTNDSASNHSESEFIEYVSDSEGEEKGEKRGFSQFDSDEDEVAEEGKRKEMKTVKRFYDEEEDSSTMTRSLEEREEPN